MIITPLAAESFGVRSSAFFIETADVKVLIDPGVSLAHVRSGLAPHALEIRAMNECWRRVKDHAARADILVITHFHFDHFDPTEPIVFNNKVLLIKHPSETINASQRERARELVRNYRTLPRRVEFADDRVFEFGSTSLRFSPAVPHGPDTAVGWVVEASVREGTSCFLYSSDIVGACREEHLEFILSEEPDTLYLDGPLTYMLGQGFSLDDLRTSISNINRLLEIPKLKTLIIDHHLLRDRNWKEEIREVYAKAKAVGKEVVTMAGFLGREEVLLEARRGKLFEEHRDLAHEPLMRSSTFHLVKELKKRHSAPSLE
jgi:predicted metallo-beta-lactamase superfamily hydrolase